MIKTVGRCFAVAAIASTVAACGGTDSTEVFGGHLVGLGPARSAPGLQWRLVTSAANGPCHVRPLTTLAAGSACGIDGSTTYVVGPTLGTARIATASIVQRDARGGAMVVAQLDTRGTASLASVTKRELRHRLAVLVGGRVIAAPVVEAPVADGELRLYLPTPAALRAFAADALGGRPVRNWQPSDPYDPFDVGRPTGFEAEARRVCGSAQPRLAPGMAYEPGAPVTPVNPAYVVAFVTRLHDRRAAALWRRQPAKERVYTCRFVARPNPDASQPSCPPGELPQPVAPDERLFFVDAHGTSTALPHGPRPSTPPTCASAGP